MFVGVLPQHDATHPVNETNSPVSTKSGSLSVVIPSYKSDVTKHVHRLDSHFLWQRGFYDTIICTTGQLSRIRKYISENTNTTVVNFDILQNPSFFDHFGEWSENKKHI